MTGKLFKLGQSYQLDNPSLQICYNSKKWTLWLPSLRDCLGTDQLVVSNWGFLHHLFFLLVLPPPPFCCFRFPLFFLIIKLSLCQLTSFHTFALPMRSLLPLGGGVSERLRGAELPTGVKPRQLAAQQ